MKLWVSENDKVKEQAGDEMVILLQNWKGKLKRYRIYRCCLWTAFALGCAALTAVTYYRIDSSIPSVIHVRAGEEQSFDLGVPARAEIVSVSDQGQSNIPEGAVAIDFYDYVILFMFSVV